MDIGVLRRDGRTDPFFDGTARDELMIKRCEPCDRWFGPDATGCPGCGADELGWARACGDASLVTWTITHGRDPDDEPAFLALVELAEGPWLHARLDGVTGLREGLPLVARFVHPAEGEAYLLFSGSRRSPQ